MDRTDYQSLIVQDLLNDQADGKLNLNPWYQRRSVWSSAQKSYLINTLFEQKPIPALYIRHSIDLVKERSVKEVVDGQQRCRAIIEYRRGDFPARLTATGRRKTYIDLSQSERERFLLTPLSVGYLLGATDSDVIDIFGRINSISKSLNPQEKRNARFSGEFKQFCLNLSTSYLSFWRTSGIFSSNDISRMNEVLFISDLVYNLINGLSDFRPNAIDNIYAANDDEFPEADIIRDRVNTVLQKLAEIDSKTFSDTIFSRQPIFFSLVLFLDGIGGQVPNNIDEKLFEIDAKFKDESVQGAGYIDFREAVSSSTQRLSSRRRRQRFFEENF